MKKIWKNCRRKFENVICLLEYDAIQFGAYQTTRLHIPLISNIYK